MIPKTAATAVVAVALTLTPGSGVSASLAPAVASAKPAPAQSRPPWAVSRSASRPGLASAAHRVGTHLRHPASKPASTAGQSWLTSAHRVFLCESHWDPRAVSTSGKYRGLIQADATFWAHNGGLRFAPRPDLATVAQQLAVAHQGWLVRGWQPWACGGLA